MPTAQKHGPSRPTSRDIAPATRAGKNAVAGSARRQTGRFEIYDALEAVYPFTLIGTIAKQQIAGLAHSPTS